LKLILDTMLGDLVVWLRILGHDATYWRRNGASLLDEALAKGSVIVTRNSKLHQKARKAGARSVLLPMCKTSEALVLLAADTGLSTDFHPENTRCPKCNTQLDQISEEPRRWRCSGCGKEYWIGRHWRNIDKFLNEVRAGRERVK